MFYRFYHQFPPAPPASSVHELFTKGEATEPLRPSAQPNVPRHAPPAGKTSLHSCGDTHPGQERENNEDNWHVDETQGVFIVCDGMGGHAAGEQASTIAVETLKARLGEAPGEHALENPSSPLLAEDLLKNAFEAANERILRAAGAHEEWQGMGCTGVVALVRGAWLHVAGVGDSRAYLWRDGALRQLTRDHSVAAELGLEGDALREHPLRNRLTMALGGEQTPVPCYLAEEMRAGDTLLLCSDGLWDMLCDAEIAALLGAALPPDETVRLLIQAANAAGGHDNITVIVARAGDGEAH